MIRRREEACRRQLIRCQLRILLLLRVERLRRGFSAASAIISDRGDPQLPGIRTSKKEKREATRTRYISMQVPSHD